MDSLSPLTASSLFGVGVDTGVWVCVMLGVDCSVSRHVINYHTGTIVGSGREQALGDHRAHFSFRWQGDFVVLVPLGEDIIAQFPGLIHHCNQQVLVLEGLGVFQLGFDLLPLLNKVFGYEVHCRDFTSILGPALLERYTVTENRLEENLPREDITRLTLLSWCLMGRLRNQAQECFLLKSC